MNYLLLWLLALIISGEYVLMRALGVSPQRSLWMIVGALTLTLALDQLGLI